MTRRLVAALAVALLLATTMLAATPQPASAAVVNPFALNYDKTIYGDFIEVGNGNMRCPTAADGVPALPGQSPAACAAARPQGGPSNGNNNFYMVQADVDADPDTFNSSTASVTIPPGASVDFARLNWGGDTGRFKLPNGTFSTIPSCTATGQTRPSVNPPGSAFTQQPRLTVAAAPSVDVAPIAVTADPDSIVGANQEQYYSGYGDVTSAFAGVATGAPIDLTVGNIWSPAGINCYAGWSIVLVYKYEQLTPVFAPTKREVFIYDGHVRQGASDPATTTTVTGFRSAGAGSRVGLTAYEGDRQINGDQFRINGTPVPEPGGSGSASNFFISHADGNVAPADFNNFSIDAKSLTTDLIPSGSTSATLSFSTSGDGYVAQNIVLSVPVPELRIAKSASPTLVRPGDPVTYTVVVTNPSTTGAVDVVVADPLVPACDRIVGALAGGAELSYTCVGTAPSAPVTNVAQVIGRSLLGDSLSGTALAAVAVLSPSIEIAKAATPTVVRPGDMVDYTITVTNTGNSALDPVSVSDPTVPACSRAIAGPLAPGAVVSYTCSAAVGEVDIVNTATATGTDALGGVVDDAATATVDVIHPAITIGKSVAPVGAQAGEPVTFSISVTNSGDVPLIGVTVTDADVPGCDRAGLALAVGEVIAYDCPTIAAPSVGFTNTASVVGNPPSGPPVGDTASAQLLVESPAVSVTKTADVALARRGDPITFTITVTNIGDVPLTATTIDPSFAECGSTIGALAIAEVVTYDCTVVAPLGPVDNTVIAIGVPPNGPSVSDTANAPVDVIAPAVSVSKTVPAGTFEVGEPVTFSITVTNDGDADLTAVQVTDPSASGCDRTFAILGAGATESYTCNILAPAEDIANTASVSAQPPIGDPVGADATALVDVVHPRLLASKSATPSTVTAGSEIRFSITVVNAGDVDLTGVTIADPIAPACAVAVPGVLPVATSYTYTCSMTAPTAGFINTITVSGTDENGAVATSAASAAIVVENAVDPGSDGGESSGGGTAGSSGRGALAATGVDPAESLGVGGLLLLAGAVLILLDRRRRISAPPG